MSDYDDADFDRHSRNDTGSSNDDNGTDADDDNASLPSQENDDEDDTNHAEDQAEALDRALKDGTKHPEEERRDPATGLSRAYLATMNLRKRISTQMLPNDPIPLPAPMLTYHLWITICSFIDDQRIKNVDISFHVVNRRHLYYFSHTCRLFRYIAERSPHWSWMSQDHLISSYLTRTRPPDQAIIQEAFIEAVGKQENEKIQELEQFLAPNAPLHSSVNSDTFIASFELFSRYKWSEYVKGVAEKYIATLKTLKEIGWLDPKNEAIFFFAYYNLHSRGEGERAKEVVKLLLDWGGCDVNVGSASNNYTVLHEAAENHDAETCDLLLANGADPYVPLIRAFSDSHQVGTTPLDVAVQELLDTPSEETRRVVEVFAKHGHTK